MSDDCGAPLPAGYRWFLRLTSWMAPRRTRSGWHAKWSASLRNWWILTERGELASGVSEQLAEQCRGALADAFWLRFSKAALHRWVRGPGFVVISTATILVLMGVCTNGFAVTRGLIRIARDLHAQPRMMPSGAQEGALIAYGFPIVFALATGIVLVLIERLPPHTRGWRYWSFLIFKTLAAMAIVPLLWIEGGAAIRAHISNVQLRVFGGGLGLALIFVAAFGYALLWIFADQRRRCPVCLERLAMPVTVGSWASVFDPAATEVLCNQGHGALCMSETETGAADQWTAFGASWRGLFDTNESKKDNVLR
ncbi:MAG TPA: hypothetical protein VMT32_10790 [Bryobacteraceae bacterium]|nr:hypothetical protein [Bryobacteraceae bacterium]